MFGSVVIAATNGEGGDKINPLMQTLNIGTIYFLHILSAHVSGNKTFLEMVMMKII